MDDHLFKTPQEGGILPLNKPQGYSSFAVVRVARAVLQEKRVGHCGTLDPMATGLLLVVYGKATRLAEKLMHQKKTYHARLLLGVKTDSGDKTGQILQTSTAIPALSENKILEIFEKFTGDIVQQTPAYSAAKVGGRKLYQYARAGLEVPRPPRHVTIHSLQLQGFTEREIEFVVECSSGTYIRTLAEDIAEALGCLGTLSALARTRIGDFTLENSLTIEQIQAMNRDHLLTHAQTWSE